MVHAFKMHEMLDAIGHEREAGSRHQRCIGSPVRYGRESGTDAGRDDVASRAMPTPTGSMPRALARVDLRQRGVGRQSCRDSGRRCCRRRAGSRRRPSAHAPADSARCSAADQGKVGHADLRCNLRYVSATVRAVSGSEGAHVRMPQPVCTGRPRPRTDEGRRLWRPCGSLRRHQQSGSAGAWRGVVENQRNSTTEAPAKALRIEPRRCRRPEAENCPKAGASRMDG